MIKSHIFDIDVLIKVDNRVWIVDKTNPSIPILKITKSDFNLINSGIYQSQGNKIEFNGRVFWLPNNLTNELKIKSKNTNFSMSNIGISMREFIDKDCIDSVGYDIMLDNIDFLKGTNDDIYIVCSSKIKRLYEPLLKRLEDRLISENIKIKDFYFVSENFYNQTEDDIKFYKIKMLLQQLIGYRIKKTSFVDEEVQRYDIVNYYDNNFDTLEITNDINPLFTTVLNRTDDSITSSIKEDVKEFKPCLVVTQISENEVNRKNSKKVNIVYSKIFKSFIKFNESMCNKNVNISKKGKALLRNKKLSRAVSRAISKDVKAGG